MKKRQVNKGKQPKTQKAIKKNYIHPADYDIIHIAYDRQNECYIAYNKYTKIFSTGICVTSAVDAYKEKLEFEDDHF